MTLASVNREEADSLIAENADLAARLTTAQIRRLEAERMLLEAKLELLQLTANPIDMEIMGPLGRASLLRSVSDNVGMPYDSIVPSDQELQTKMQQQAQGPQGQMGIQESKPGGQERPGEETDNMHRVST